MSTNIVPIRPYADLSKPRASGVSTRQEVRKLASALVIALNIAPGTALVLALGNGSEDSNFEAIETWVRVTLAREQLPPGRLALQVLLPALEARLHTIAERMPQL